jgi:hypothetical protein
VAAGVQLIKSEQHILSTQPNIFLEHKHVFFYKCLHHPHHYGCFAVGNVSVSGVSAWWRQ